MSKQLLLIPSVIVLLTLVWPSSSFLLHHHPQRQASFGQRLTKRGAVQISVSSIKNRGRRACLAPLYAEKESVAESKKDEISWQSAGAAGQFRSLRQSRICDDDAAEIKGLKEDLYCRPSDRPDAGLFVGFRLRESDEYDASHAGAGFNLTLRGILWFFLLLWPYITFALACSLASQAMAVQAATGMPLYPGSTIGADLQVIHGFVGTILGFTIGFRTNAAYDRYYEGRRLLSTIMENSRAIIRDVYSFILKPGHQEEDDVVVTNISDDIRRRLDILFAFIRQSVRESVKGFSPDSSVKDVPFSNKTYFLDTSNPQLLDLLTKEEADRYACISARSRPGAVSAEINIILQILGTRFQYVDAFIGKTQSHLSNIVNAHFAMLRIRDTPLPYPYVLILNIAVFLFVFTTPFIYNTGTEGRFLGVQFLVFSYYGILQIGESIENPFAYDTFDLDLADFAQNLHQDTVSTATTLRDDRKVFIKEYLSDKISCE